MTNPHSPESTEDETQTPDSVRDSDPMLTVLRGALAEPPAPKRSLLPRIQERIRRRTRGRYFRDRYSKSVDPVPMLLVMALFFLLIAAAIYLVLRPLVEPASVIELQPSVVDPLAVPKPPRAP